MKNISLNPLAMNDFLYIIHVYGSYLKLRNVVKNFDHQKIMEPLKSEYQHSDRYDSHFECYVSNTEVVELLSKTGTSILNVKENLINELKRTEKHYKKLKHTFKENYPELNDEMLAAIAIQQAQINQKNINKDKLFLLSNRFVSFFHYTFGGSDRMHLAYKSFAENILNKYKIVYDEKYCHDLYNKLEFDYKYKNKKPYKLNFNDIEFLADILAKFVNSVQPEDLIQIDYTVTNSKDENKLKIATQIINENFLRFSKLLKTYKEHIKNI